MAANSDPSAKKRPRGRPFEKGDPRINRTGRPVGFAQLVREQTDDNAEQVAMMRLVAQGKARMTVGAPGEEREVYPTWRDVIEANKWLAAYGQGLPTQTLRHEGEDGGPLQVAISITRTVKKPEGD